METKSRTIPSFRVLKNGLIIKNVLLQSKDYAFSSEDDELLYIGNDRECFSNLGHPSITGFHLRIQLNQKAHSVNIIALSSVPETWVSGNKVVPGDLVPLNEGDRVQISGSSFLYELHWLSVNDTQTHYDDPCCFDNDFDYIDIPGKKDRHSPENSDWEYLSDDNQVPYSSEVSHNLDTAEFLFDWFTDVNKDARSRGTAMAKKIEKDIPHASVYVRPKASENNGFLPDTTPTKEAQISGCEFEQMNQMMDKERPNTSDETRTGRKLTVLREAKKRWVIVVETSTFLNDQSFDHLKVLKGLKGTQLFIPKIVKKELTDLKSQYAFYKRNTVKASLALEWIDAFHNDDDTILNLQTETEVIQTAILLRQEISDGIIVILSNDIPLKMRAMSEGLMCEGADDFLSRLVNPHSDRLMCGGSSARGLMDLCEDDAVNTCNDSNGDGVHRLTSLSLMERRK